jgi:hypothetical protein
MWRRAAGVLAARGATAARAALPPPPHTCLLPTAAAPSNLASARRLACLGPPPPFYDDYCAGASKLDRAAEFHAVTGNQGDMGDMEFVSPPKPCCIAFMSWASPACRSFGPAFDALTLQHPGVRFYRVDLEAEEPARLALEQGVTVRPRRDALSCVRFFRMRAG